MEIPELRPAEGRIVVKLDELLYQRRMTLTELAEAHRYVESGHKKGNVVVTIDQPGPLSTE